MRTSPVPRQAGGILFSDSLARIVFLPFIVLSIPVGFHHQFTDPGIGGGVKFFHAILTYGARMASFRSPGIEAGRLPEFRKHRRLPPS